jgi:hypothetical protein
MTNHFWKKLIENFQQLVVFSRATVTGTLILVTEIVVLFSKVDFG